VEVFAGLAAGFERDQPAIAADAVVLVHDRRAFGQLAKVADDRLGLAPDAPATARLRGAFGEQLALGEDGDLRCIEREAVFEWGDGDGERRRVAGRGSRVPGPEKRTEIRQ